MAGWFDRQNRKALAPFGQAAATNVQAQMQQPARKQRVSFSDADQQAAAAQGSTLPIASTATGGLQAERDAGGNLVEAAAPAAPAAAAPVTDYYIGDKGALEHAYDQYGQQLFQPGAMSAWNQAYSDRYAAPDANQQLWAQQANQPLANNAQAEYDAYGARRRQAAMDPQYGSYFDNAVRNATNDINTQLGARGAYGSSVGLGQLGKSITDIRAQQAEKEANYNLARLAEDRQWNELGGTLARNADLTGQGNLANRTSLANNAATSERERLDSWRGAADAAGQEDIARNTLGYSAAGAAQTAREGRAQTAYDIQSKTSGLMESIFGSGWENLLGMDSSFLDAILGPGLAGATDARNFSTNNNALMNISNWVGRILGGFKSTSG